MILLMKINVKFVKNNTLIFTSELAVSVLQRSTIVLPTKIPDRFSVKLVPVDSFKILATLNAFLLPFRIVPKQNQN